MQKYKAEHVKFLSTVLEITNIDVYVKKPKYILMPIILTMISVSTLMLIEETFTWTLYQWTSIILIFFAFIIVAFGAGVRIKRWIWDERQYNRILKNPFEHEFIIPPTDKIKISYYNQKDRPQRVKEINIPVETELEIIIVRTTTKLDLEVRESQYSFGGEEKIRPEIIRYDNPYVRVNFSEFKWFRDWFNWEGIYHLTGNRPMHKGVTYTDGFSIKPHDKGKFMFEMKFIVSCKKYKNLEKEKNEIVETKLNVNIV